MLFLVTAPHSLLGGYNILQELLLPYYVED